VLTPGTGVVVPDVARPAVAWHVAAEVNRAIQIRTIARDIARRIAGAALLLALLRSVARLVGSGAFRESPTQHTQPGDHPEATNRSERQLRTTGPTSVCAVSAAKALIGRYVALVQPDSSQCESTHAGTSSCGVRLSEAVAAGSMAYV